MRKLLLIALGFAVLLAAGVFFGSSLGWKVKGWLASETFYDGMPSSYWRKEARECDSFPLAPRHTYGRNMVDDSSLLQAQQLVLGMKEWPDDHPLFRGDPDAVPVLLELLDDDDHQVKMIAAKGLGHIGPESRAGFSRLQRELDHKYDIVRRMAAEAMHRIDPEEAARTGVTRPPPW
jgi:hypothetical protein